MTAGKRQGKKARRQGEDLSDLHHYCSKKSMRQENMIELAKGKGKGKGKGNDAATFSKGFPSLLY